MERGGQSWTRYNNSGLGLKLDGISQTYLSLARSTQRGPILRVERCPVLLRAAKSIHLENTTNATVEFR